MGSLTTIQLKCTTRDLLRSLGKKGETYDALIRQMIISQRTQKNSSSSTDCVSFPRPAQPVEGTI